MSNANGNNSTSHEVSHYVVTAHPPGSVLMSTKCNFLSPNSMDVLVAKSGRLEVRQLRSSSSSGAATDGLANDAMEGCHIGGADSFPVVLQLPINGRLTVLEALKIPSIPTAAIFMLLDRNQYAVVSYAPQKPFVSANAPGQLPKVSTYPVYTHATGSLDTGDLSHANETGTLVAVDPHFRCIALHCFDGLLSILPIDQNYVPPPNSVATGASKDDGTRTSNSNPRRPKQLLGTPFHCRMEEQTILAMTFLHTNTHGTTGSTSTSATGPDVTASQPPLQLAVLYQDARGSQHVTTHVINLPKKQMHFYGSQSVPAPVQWLKKSAVDGGSAMLIPVQLPLPSSSGSSSSTAETPYMASASAASVATDSYAEQARLLGAGGGSASRHGPAVIVIGQRQFTYCSTTTTKIIPVPQALFLAYTELPRDPETNMPRYLLADELSNLHMLSIVSVADRIIALQLETLGSCALASTLCYLREGLLYVGSGLGDSQLIQISDEPIAPLPTDGNVNGMGGATTDGMDPDATEAGTDVLLDTTYLSVVEEYTNLGPILDFDLVPTAPKGAPPTTAEGWQIHQQTMAQSQVVTASGTSKSGSIRVVRNGIGMNEYAAVEIPGIQAMWSLRQTYGAFDDTYLVQSFVGETRVLGVVTAGGGGSTAMEDDHDVNNEDVDDGDVAGTLEEVVIPGLDSASSSLYIGNIQSGDRILQITGSEVRLLSWSGGVLSTWQGQITVAAANEAGQVVVALQGGVLVYLTVESDQIQMNTKKQMDREISCVDIHPFAIGGKDEHVATAMDVDTAGESSRASQTSALVAVGMWDDFTVRILSIDSALGELVCINLSTSEEDEDVGDQGAGAVRRNRNNMMARSLCLITLDFSSGGNSDKGATSPGVNMLFIGLGDGTLVSFAVVSNKGTVSVQSKKEVCLGTQRIDLVPLITEQGGTCVLATGDRPTVIYLAGVGGTVHLSNPKLCYSNVNVAASDDDEGDDVSRPQSKQQTVAVNVAAPFFSPLLFDGASLGKQHYSLCVADETSLRLGVIDDIQKLHVTTCRLGMAPRRIVHCVDGRLFAVGCIESGIQNIGLGGDEANMGNCIRFMDDTTFDDLERFHLDPYEMILSMIYVSLKVPASGKDMADGMTPGSIYKPFLLVGTAYALPDEDEPTRGRILVYSCQEDDSTASSADTNRRAVRQVTEFSVMGGVYSMCLFYDGKFLATVNTRTHVCQLVEDTGLLRLQYVGLGHFGHILSLFVKSRAQPPFEGPTSTSAAVDDVTATKAKETTTEPDEMLAIVGDLMRSISLVQYYPQHQTLEEIARDFNANWTCAVEMLNDNVYLGAENWHNLFCLRRNTTSASEEIRCRLDTIGEYHLGEMCNKFMAGSLVMPVSASNAPSRRQVRRDVSPSKRQSNKEASPTKSGATRVRRPVVSTGSQTLFGTVDGTLGVVMGLDARTTAFFATLERAMANVIRQVGEFSHSQHRACHAERRIQPAHGFIDGDLVESFLDLDRVSMEAIVTEMNRDGNWDIDDAATRTEDALDKAGEQEEKTAQDSSRSEDHDLSVDDVLAMVEEMTMLH